MIPTSKLLKQDVRTRFAELVRQPDNQINLALAALLIAAEEEPGVDVESYLARLDEMGAEACRRIKQHIDDPVAQLNEYLFQDLNFTGNLGNYYDPRNSLLNHVLDQRTGIPITLSLVYIEVGRRAGLRVEGVGMPGHFIVRVFTEQLFAEGTLVDPFEGRTITEDDCQERLDTFYSGQVPLRAEHLRTFTTKDFLARMLRNLQAIYAQAKLHRQTLAVVERLLLLAPEAIEERRNRGTLLAHLNRYAEAVTELQAYLQLAPNAADTDAVREQLSRLQGRLAAQN